MPFPEHKLFVVRRIAAEATALSGASVPGSPKSQVIAQLTQAFVDVPTPTLISNQALEKLLFDQLKAISKLQVPGSRAHRNARAEFIAALTARIKDNRCRHCGAKKSHICDGTAVADKQKLESVGHCVRSIGEQFHFLRKVVGALIARHAFAGDTSSLADVDIDLAWNFPPPGTLPQGTVVGRTEFHDAFPRRLSEITIEPESQSFDWQSLLSISWLLAHEVVCHAYEGKARVPRQVCEPQCAFYEGWMDEVALQTLDALLNSSITISGDIDEPVPVAFLDHAQEILREAQQQRLRHPGPPPLTFGRQAALLALEYFQSADQRTRRLQTRGKALEQLLGLSYQVQHCNPDALQAELVVTHVFNAINALPRANFAKQLRLRDLLSTPIANLSVWLQELGKF